MSPEKYAALTERMQKHSEVEGIAVVVITAAELAELLEAYCDCGSGARRGNCICDNDE